MVLVNGETGGAAEALAAALREADAGLIIGNPTAGLAMTTRDFPLKNGERLRIAMNPVKLGNGVAISHVAPDIAVTVSPDDERAYLKNPYLTLAQNNAPATVGTNDFLPFVDHTSEADLVQAENKGRRRRGGHRAGPRQITVQTSDPGPGAGAGRGFDQGTCHCARIPPLISALTI